MSTHLQLEELSLLLTRLRRHQAKLASVRNFAIGQLLQHQLTFPTCQVSTGGLLSGPGAGSDMLARVRSCPCSDLSLLSASPLFAACLLLDATARYSVVVEAEPTLLALGRGTACGVGVLNCRFSGCK